MRHTNDISLDLKASRSKFELSLLWFWIRNSYWKANHCDIPPQCSIPNLYYKMDDDNTLPDYICATPNSFGECFWSKYFQSNPIIFNLIQIFSTESKYFQPNPNCFNPIQMNTCSWSQGCTNATTCPGIRRTPRWAWPIDGDDVPTNTSN